MERTIMVAIFASLGFVLVAGLVVVPSILEAQAAQTAEKCSEKGRGGSIEYETGKVKCIKPG